MSKILSAANFSTSLGRINSTASALSDLISTASNDALCNGQYTKANALLNTLAQLGQGEIIKAARDSFITLVECVTTYDKANNCLKSRKNAEFLGRDGAKEKAEAFDFVAIWTGIKAAKEAKKEAATKAKAEAATKAKEEAATKAKEEAEAATKAPDITKAKEEAEAAAMAANEAATKAKAAIIGAVKIFTANAMKEAAAKAEAAAMALEKAEAAAMALEKAEAKLKDMAQGIEQAANEAAAKAAAKAAKKKTA
jgi:hypothetical protein